MIGNARETSDRGTAAMGLSDDARKAMNATFDAMSDWRNELAASTERNTSKVFDRMSVAAKSMGWPAEIVDQTRKQMLASSKMQLQMIDQIMDAWENQMKSPGQAFALQGFSMPQFPGFPSIAQMMPFGGAGFDLGQMQMAPFQFWMQAAETWQKSWLQAMSSIMDSQSAWMQTPAARPGPASMLRSPLTH